MGYNLTSPVNSFVQYRDIWKYPESWHDAEKEGNPLGLALPYTTAFLPFGGELQHQFIITAANSGEADTLMTMYLGYLQMAILMGGNATVPPALPTTGTVAFTTGLSLFIERYRLSATTVLIYIPKFPYAASFNPANHKDECFQLCFYIKEPSDAPLLKVISNAFYFESDKHYTTLFTYYGNEDEAGFTYCPSDTILNKVRLPIYLRKPAYPEDEVISRDSKGNVHIDKSVVTKQYEVKTDYFPEWMLDCMRAMLVHDEISVIGTRYTGKVVKSGSFEPQWQDNDYPLAPVVFKLDASPFIIKNNNCGECAEYDPIHADDTPEVHPPSEPDGHTWELSLSELVTPESVRSGLTFFMEIVEPDVVTFAELIVITVTDEQHDQVGTYLSYTVAADVEAENLPVILFYAVDTDGNQSNVAQVILTITE